MKKHINKKISNSTQVGKNKEEVLKMKLHFTEEQLTELKIILEDSLFQAKKDLKEENFLYTDRESCIETIEKIEKLQTIIK